MEVFMNDREKEEESRKLEGVIREPFPHEIENN